MELENIVIDLALRTHPEFKDSSIGKPVRLLTEDDIEQVAFGLDYAGQFVLRHPNLGDKNKIAAAMTNALLAAGFKSPEDAPVPVRNQEYGFAVLEVLAIEKPPWAEREVLSTDLDTLAIGELGMAFAEAVQAKKKRFSNGSTK